MIKLGIVMDPIASINIKKDTSFAMLLEAQRRGYQLHYMEMADLYLHQGKPARRRVCSASATIRPAGIVLTANRISRWPISM